jgi:hypothetical protein
MEGIFNFPSFFLRPLGVTNGLAVSWFGAKTDQLIGQQQTVNHRQTFPCVAFPEPMDIALRKVGCLPVCLSGYVKFTV